MDNPTLTAKTVLAIDTVSIQLTQNTIVPVAPLLGLLYEEAIDQEMNVQMFSSSNPFTGVLQEGSVAVYTMPTGSTAFSVVSFDDLLGTLNKVATKVRWRGDWVMHPDTLRYVVGLEGLAGPPDLPAGLAGWVHGSGLRADPDQTAGRPGRLFGRPLYVTDAMPSTSGSGKPFIVYGWFKFGHAFGDHTPLAIDWSEHAGFKSVLDRDACVAHLRGQDDPPDGVRGLQDRLTRVMAGGRCADGARSPTSLFAHGPHMGADLLPDRAQRRRVRCSRRGHVPSPAQVRRAARARRLVREPGRSKASELAEDPAHGRRDRPRLRARAVGRRRRRRRGPRSGTCSTSTGETRGRRWSSTRRTADRSRTAASGS
jgi:hypothetical protein